MTTPEDIAVHARVTVEVSRAVERQGRTGDPTYREFQGYAQERETLIELAAAVFRRLVDLERGQP
jgi:hypothetical protein